MFTTTEPAIRELDRRYSDGLDVRLLWDSHSNEIAIAVCDQRLGQSFELPVAPADAREAFHHPYAYGPRPPAASARRGAIVR